jgi:hypothetical protein
MMTLVVVGFIIAVVVVLYLAFQLPLRGQANQQEKNEKEYEERRNSTHNVQDPPQ